MASRRSGGGYGWPHSWGPVLVPTVRVYRSAAEAEASRAVDTGEHVSRVRRACRRLLVLAIVEGAVIAGLLVFIVRKSSS